MVMLNREDIDFNERECVVIGKGNKERLVYFDARTKIHLPELPQRAHGCEPGTVRLAESSTRPLMIGGVETRLRSWEKV